MSEEAICHVCGHQKCFPVLSLGQTPLANSFVSKEALTADEPCYPLAVYFCQQCYFVQLGCTIPSEALFTDYVYLSSISSSLRANFKDLADDIKQRVSTQAFVVEIASNDGAMLENFEGYHRLGVEPATNIAKIATDKSIPTFNRFFDAASATEIKDAHGAADVILGTNVFAHIPDLNALMENLKLLLAEEGVAVFESPYLVDLLDKKAFDTIYHEHVYYLSVIALDSLVKRHGLVLSDVKHTDMHGGSIRFFIQRAGRGAVSESVDAFIAREKSLGLDKVEAYRDFAAEVEALKSNLCTFLDKLKAQGARIAAYGATAKGNTLLNYMGIDKTLLDCVIDKNPLKQNHYTPGTHIPVLSVEAANPVEKIDYMLLLAWNYADEIMAEQADYRAKGGQFIMPIPEPHLLS